MTWVDEYNYTLCGTIIPKEFEPPVFTADEESVLTEQEKKDIIYKAYQNWMRVDFKKVKLVPFAYTKLLEEYDYDESIDSRVVYIADKANHCIRRILIKQANVDTFAGVCGFAGFKDGLFNQNLLNNPELVAADHNGTVYIWDSGNNYVRIVDPVTKIMSTMI
jgi:hypothetical protein